jgi:hypothetical protein
MHQNIFKWCMICAGITGFMSKCFPQFCAYTIYEKDSVVMLTDTVAIGRQPSLYIRITEPLYSHAYYFKFCLKNETDSIQCSFMGTEGVIRPVTKQLILYPGETRVVTYQFSNVRDWGGSFSQQGRIRSYACDQEDNYLSGIMLFHTFLLSGKWID